MTDRHDRANKPPSFQLGVEPVCMLNKDLHHCQKREKMAVLEINDWDDSVRILFVPGKKEERTEKRSLLKKND